MYNTVIRFSLLALGSDFGAEFAVIHSTRMVDGWLLSDSCIDGV
jgi:hypothetical protein